MLKGVEFRGYRGASSRLDGFAKINLFLGPNNSGKSTCLEAVAAASVRSLSDLLSYFVSRRGASGWSTTMSLVNPRGDFMVRALGSEKQYPHLVRVSEGTLTFGYYNTNDTADSPGFLTAHGARGMPLGGSEGAVFVTDELVWVDRQAVTGDSVLEEAVSAAERAGARQRLKALVDKFVPGVSDLRLHVNRGRTVLYVEEGDKYWPALVGGDGFKRLLFLAANLAVTNERQVFIVEEPDAFLHRKGISHLAALLVEAVSRPDGPQIFLSTHSIDLVRSLIGKSEESPDLLAVFKISRTGDKIDAERYDSTAAEMRQPELERVLGFIP